MGKRSNKISSILSLILIISVALTGFALTSKKLFDFDIRKQASGEQLEITLVNSSAKIQPNQAFTVDLEINTKGKLISGLQFVGEITGVDQDKSGLIVNQIPGLITVFTQMEKSGANLKFKLVELSSIGSSPFTTHDKNQKVATLFLYPLNEGEIKITLDQNQSGATEFEKDFLQSNITQTAYNIEIDDNRSIGGSEPAPPDGGIHRSCNEYCADSNECASEFSCYYNKCRNPKNLTEEQCTDPIIIAQPIITQSVAIPQQKGANQPTPTPFKTNYVSLTSTPVKEESTTSSALATVIITQASTSAKPTNNIEKTATKSTAKVTNLGSARSNDPAPIVENANDTKQQNSNLPFLILAAVVTGILGIGAIVFILKNLN